MCKRGSKNNAAGRFLAFNTQFPEIRILFFTISNPVFFILRKIKFVFR